jgi:hypothetical protein
VKTEYSTVQEYFNHLNNFTLSLYTTDMTEQHIFCNILRSEFNLIKLHLLTYLPRGPGSLIIIATGYGLEGPGIESRWGARLFAHVQTGPGAHPASCKMGTVSFLGIKRPGRGAGHPRPSSAEVTKG